MALSRCHHVQSKASNTPAARGSQQTVLYRGQGLTAGLSYYAPGQRMRRHSHDYHQVSWLLTGEMLEAGDCQERDLYRFSCGIKPAEFRHENRYGPAGSLILAVNIDPERWPDILPATSNRWQWQAPESPQTQSQVTQLLALLTDREEASEAVILDLVALSRGGVDATPRQSGRTRRPPAWLAELREQLRDGADNSQLSQLAESAGVHRVSLSRRFRCWFGTPPSVYRSRCMLARAMAGLAAGQPIVASAISAGFADQAHLTRAARSHTGLTPVALQRLANHGSGVTSVQ
ncbi:MAG: helix-turn-helix domain-containing protein [Pseudomonadota bacterium]